jgi:D-ribose pyranase
MKKTALLNPLISGTIASIGHTEKLVIADAGLPIPDETKRIDLALTKNIPPFIATLQVVLQEMKVERVILAEEIQKAAPQLLEEIRGLLGDVPFEFVPHETFKTMLPTAKAVIRTGEFTPYANIILVSGVVF